MIVVLKYSVHNIVLQCIHNSGYLSFYEKLVPIMEEVYYLNFYDAKFQE